MNSRTKVKMIVGIALLMAIMLVLQFISNYIKFGPFSITLALIPIAVGAMLYGPFTGLLLGAVLGAFILITGGGEPFFSINPLATIALCLSKTSIAGFISGLISRFFRLRHEKVGIVLSSLSVPVINTGIFVAASIVIFTDYLSGLAGEGENLLIFVVTGLIGINFLIEFSVNVILSSSIVYLVRLFRSKRY